MFDDDITHVFHLQKDIRELHRVDVLSSVERFCDTMDLLKDSDCVSSTGSFIHSNSSNLRSNSTNVIDSLRHSMCNWVSGLLK